MAREGTLSLNGRQKAPERPNPGPKRAARSVGSFSSRGLAVPRRCCWHELGSSTALLLARGKVLMLPTLCLHAALALVPSTGPPACSRADLLRTAVSAVGASLLSSRCTRPAVAIPPADNAALPVEEREVVIYRPPAITSKSTAKKVKLARHLKASGARMYGAYWCSHCFDQKQAFGADANRLLQYVECAADGYGSERPLCRAKGIKGYPTWEINGEFYPGEKDLEELGELSGFKG